MRNSNTGVITKIKTCTVNQVDTGLNGYQTRISAFDRVIRVKDTSNIGCQPRLYEPRHKKTNILASDLVQHKPGCAAAEDG